MDALALDTWLSTLEIRLCAPCQECGHFCTFPGDEQEPACPACGKAWTWPGFDLTGLGLSEVERSK